MTLTIPSTMSLKANKLQLQSATKGYSTMVHFGIMNFYCSHPHLAVAPEKISSETIQRNTVFLAILHF